jgi:uncharacterized protein YcfL
MRKLALLAFVTVAFVACNKTETPAPVVDTTAVVAAPVDTSKKDTTKVDTTKKIDSAKKAAVDTAKKAKKTEKK